MPQKFLKAKKQKIGPKKTVTDRTQSPAVPDSHSIVLVGTYKEKQLAWIKKNGVYNYPVKNGDEFDAEALGKIAELWLYADAKATRHCFAADFVGKMTCEEFLAAHPTYAKLDKPKKSAKAKPAVSTKSENREYYVFKTSPLDYGPQLENPLVLIRAADFAKGYAKKVAKAVDQFKADGEFAPLAVYLPTELAQVPRHQLRVCEAAVQLRSPIMVSPQPKFRIESALGRRSAFKAISLFSGAGGLDIGVSQAGFNVLACVELDHNACDTLRSAANREHRRTQVFEGDITALEPKTILDAVGMKSGEVDLLFGGPPCQAFSLIGKQKALDDERGMLLFQMIRYTKVIQPRVVLMEQVKGLLSARDMSGRRGGVLEKLLADFADLGYIAKYKVCLAADYGAAQLRERVILVATKGKNGFEFPPPKFQDPHEANLFSFLPSWRTVGEVLQGLPKPHAKIAGTTSYPDEFDNHVDVTPVRDRERIHPVPEGLYLASQTHLPVELLRGLKAKDTTKYLRLNRRKPSNTLRCGEIFFHPTEDRYLTPREYMRIHGYPDDYLLKGPIRSRTGTVKTLDQHRLVANSVPPPLAFAMANQIRKYMEDAQ